MPRMRYGLQNYSQGQTDGGGQENKRHKGHPNSTKQIVGSWTEAELKTGGIRYA